jgi:hypothetical protein
MVLEGSPKYYIFATKIGSWSPTKQVREDLAGIMIDATSKVQLVITDYFCGGGHHGKEE